MFQGSFKGVLRMFRRYFKKVFRVFQERLKGLSREFSGCFKEDWWYGHFSKVSRLFQENFMDVLWKSEGYYEGVLWVFRGYLNEVLLVYQGSFKLFQGCFKAISKVYRVFQGSFKGLNGDFFIRSLEYWGCIKFIWSIKNISQKHCIFEPKMKSCWIASNLWIYIKK